MNDRQPLEPVPGLARPSRIMSPPRRQTPRNTGSSDQDTTEIRPVGTRTVAAAPTPPMPGKPRLPGRIRSTTLSLPVSVAAKLRDRAARDETSQADVVMDAVSATRDDLGHLVAVAQPVSTSDDLFVRRAGRHSDEPLTTLSLRMLAGNLDAIDQLVEEHAARSRSQLCVAALRSYLGGS